MTTTGFILSFLFVGRGRAGKSAKTTAFGNDVPCPSSVWPRSSISTITSRTAPHRCRRRFDAAHSATYSLPHLVYRHVVLRRRERYLAIDRNPHCYTSLSSSHPEKLCVVGNCAHTSFNMIGWWDPWPLTTTNSYNCAGLRNR
jgi:hypothetical protein